MTSSIDPKVFISASAAGYYGNAGLNWCSEEDSFWRRFFGKALRRLGKRAKVMS